VYTRISPVTQAKINALLEEMRGWEPGETPSTLHELSCKHDLDVFVVDRLARAEGFVIPAGTPILDDEPLTDPNADTIDLDPDKVHEAAMKPDPNPDWQKRDEDTGIWKKKPTGEWERIKKKS